MEYQKKSSKNVSTRSTTILLVLLSLIFLGSVIFTLIKQRNVVRREQALVAMQKAEESLKIAQDLVGLDDEEARERLNLGREELLRAERLGIPERRANDVRENFLEIENQILKIQELTVRKVFDFSSIGEKTDLVSVVFVPGSESLLLLDKKSSKLWHFSNLTASQPVVETISLSFPGNLEGLSASEEGMLVWGTQGFARLQPSLELGEVQSLDSGWQVTDVSLFSDWVYVLSSAQNQVFKFYPSVFGYDYVPWLGEEIEVGGHSLMLIDGDIYIWSESFYKFRRGVEQDFYVRTQLDLPLEQIAAMAGWQNSNFLYLLDPKNVRVLKFDKYGVLDAQFRTDKLRNARDLALSSDEKYLYFVTENKLFMGLLE
ncbi:MAG: hypothetical protein U9M98_03005 [Patescibacteria group bacterium]|nr:hypothetical protein [Patescibacteria group bacterium]